MAICLGIYPIFRQTHITILTNNNGDLTGMNWERIGNFLGYHMYLWSVLRFDDMEPRPDLTNKNGDFAGRTPWELPQNWRVTSVPKMRVTGGKKAANSQRSQTTSSQMMSDIGFEIYCILLPDLVLGDF